MSQGDSRQEPEGPASPGPTISFAFNLGKVPDQGEDSDPILRTGRDLALVAVFDGMGGAGGTVYETPDGPRSGAYLASRLARDVVEQRMLEVLEPEWNLDGPSTAEDLRDATKEALVARLSELNAPPSRLRSKLLRALPTTMALVALQRPEAGASTWAGHVMWAGDSRAYVVEPDAGARQLTTDDIRDAGDAMANLRQDSVVTNAISADADFVVHYRHVELTSPFLILAATDGCFGYVPTPMHFEHMLLAELAAADGPKAWSHALQERITAVTGDDAAMAVVGVGADFEELQALFAARATELAERFTGPLDELEREVASAKRELERLQALREDRRGELWAAYKAGYEHHLDTAVLCDEEVP